ncbi:hypothetical protein HAX54_001070 [Datura stramonium]|uniref:Uncharacterized protein n=1 Tax=Datura stramonium TaxID=4076 RepID=A0ABS8T1X0_DATST|nr:hypothetical protein [Datura stramonium]
MDHKVNEGKDATSSSHGNNRSRGTQEAPMEDESMPQQPPRRYGNWTYSQWPEFGRKVGPPPTVRHVTHVTRERVYLMFALLTKRLVSVGVIIKDTLRREMVKKGIIFSFEGLLTQFLREKKINEEVVDYRLRYDPKRLDVTKRKELKGIHGPVLSINKRNAFFDNGLSHLVGPGFEKPFDDDDSIDEEQDGVNSGLESDDDGDDSEMGGSYFCPHR